MMKVFEELEIDSCRWPLFDCNLPGEKGTFLFCGECAARSGLPYCREHMAMAYRKSQVAMRCAQAHGPETAGGGARRSPETDRTGSRCLKTAQRGSLQIRSARPFCEDSRLRIIK
jgi:hypothetical protein